MAAPVIYRRARMVVLLGIGHAHLHVLRHWRSHAPGDVGLVCVSDFPVAAYSGMLPGVLAGEYSRHAMEVPLAPLCAAAGATLVVDGAASVDAAAHRVRLSDGRDVEFDRLSVAIGSVPGTGDARITDGADIVLTKPMQTFVDRLETACLRHEVGDARPVSLAVVGGGAGGVEIALTLPTFVRRHFGAGAVTGCTLIAGDGVLANSSAQLRARARAALLRADVHVMQGRVATATPGMLSMESGETVAGDIVVWATTAAASPILATLNLPTDPAGFLVTTRHLHSVSDHAIFAAGDCGSIEGRAVPKAGVHAVREGPVLLDNLLRSLQGRPLQPYRPQPSFLKLLNVGDGTAIGEWSGYTFGGRWARHLKDAIDRRFMARYQPWG